MSDLAPGATTPPFRDPPPPHPLAASDWRSDYADQNLRMAQKMLDQQGEINALKARLTNERAQVLAEVDAALRDDGAFHRWVSSSSARSVRTNLIAADYLRDTLGADGD